MEKFKENYLRFEKIENNINKLRELLYDAELAEKEIKKLCEHDLILVYKRGQNNLVGDIFYGVCLLCNKNVHFNSEYKIYDYEMGLLEESVLPDSIIDITTIINERARDNWQFGVNMCAEAAKDKFKILMNIDVNLDLNEVKNSIINGLKKYEETVYEKKIDFKEFTAEEVNVALKHDDNTEIINAINEECVDLCSEDVKKKIK